MPEEEVAGEGEAGEEARTSEGFPRPGIVRLLEPHPSVEHRQRQRDAPEGARERPDPLRGGEPHEDRREAERDRAGDERDQRGCRP